MALRKNIPANLDNPAAYGAVPGNRIFSQTLEAALKRAEARMFENVSPRMHKITGDGLEIIPACGSIIAANHSSDPDYFFDWVRDSANVMRAVVALYERENDRSKMSGYLKSIVDYLEFTEHLRYEDTPFGLGEVRFNADGTVDKTFWSRPQFDGPALRALTLMRFLTVDRVKRPWSSSNCWRNWWVRSLIARDLDYLADHWHEPCFDMWESYLGEYYATRVFALSAFARAQDFFASWGDKARAERYKAAADTISKHLDLYWRPEQGVFAYSRGPLADVHGEPREAPGHGIDAGVVMASVLADVPEGPHSLSDPRLMSTAAANERIFAEAYPINSNLAFGPGTAIGRHIGDTYYGGNAWYFLQGAYVELMYKLAAYLAHQQALIVTAENEEFLRVVARRMSLKPWAPGENVFSTIAGRKALVCGLRQRGDDFLWMMMSVIPPDGEMTEQFDKETGMPRGATGQTWSFSALITAGLARAAAVAGENSI